MAGQQQLDPEIMVVAVKALRAAEKAGGSQRLAADLAGEMLGRPVNFNTYRRWLMNARSLGLDKMSDAAKVRVNGLVSYQWSDLENEGWTRVAHRADRKQVSARDNGTFETTTYADPGAMYPPGWTGPMATDKPKVKFLNRNPGGRGWIVTSAQNETPVHGPFMLNLKAYAAAKGYPQLVAGTTYGKEFYEKFLAGDRDVESSRIDAWSSVVEPFITRDRHDLGDILFCAEMNTLPTATRPLSGLTGYGKGKSAIFPHPKIAQQSVPRPAHKDPVWALTTGSVTVPRYVQRKAGLKARFHHIISAVIVEYDAAGTPFIRHLVADAETGQFQDIDIVIDRGVVTTGQTVEAITWGDIHHEQIDRVVAAVNWGKAGIFETLRPRHQFVHDLLDFRRRNHHPANDPMHGVRMHYAGTVSVEDEVSACASFVASIKRPWCQTVIVESNHDTALARWLRESDWRTDPANAKYWLEMNLAQVHAAANDNDFNVFRHALSRCGSEVLDGVTFVSETDSYEVLGIECGMHGHISPNGARGNPMSLAGMSMRLNVGHQHSPSIVDGVYTAGLSGKLDQTYNKGPTGWAHTHILVYPNGKRTLLTISNGKWRAGVDAISNYREAA